MRVEGGGGGEKGVLDGFLLSKKDRVSEIVRLIQITSHYLRLP